MHLSDDVGDHGDDIVSDCDEDDDDHALVYIHKHYESKTRQVPVRQPEVSP